MEGKSTAKLYYLFAIICGTWFLATSWAWPYFANLMFSYPVALIGLFLWSRGKKLNPGSRASIISVILFGLGFLTSMLALGMFYFFN